MAKNLLKNPSGEENMEFWELTKNTGSKWRVEDMPGVCGHAFNDEAVTKYFATSYELCLKKQVVDLLAEGFQPVALDAHPAVTVEDWYCGRTDCSCTYQLEVALLDENKKIIQQFKPDKVTQDPKCSWTQVTHTFSDYGPGLRFISFEHGGRDSKGWDGWYGVRVTGSSVTVQVTTTELQLTEHEAPPVEEQAKTNLLKNPCGEGDLEFWELTANGGSYWRVEDMPGACGHAFSDGTVTKYFATSNKLCLKKQVVDLLAEGFQTDALDAQPTVIVEDWYCGRSDSGFAYQLTVSLLDKNKKVLQEFKPGKVTVDSKSMNCPWRRVTLCLSLWASISNTVQSEYNA